MIRIVAFILSLSLIGCAAPTIKATKKLNIDSLGVWLFCPSLDTHGDQFADSVAQNCSPRSKNSGTVAHNIGVDRAGLEYG